MEKLGNIMNCFMMKMYENSNYCISCMIKRYKKAVVFFNKDIFSDND